jgi:replicative DNA helicase
VVFVSCEVEDKALGFRILAREGRIDNRAFREGLGNSMTLLPKMRNAADRLADLPLSIMDSSCRAVRPAEVRKWARKLGHPAMIVVDYLQLMYPDEKHDSREREIADMSRSMKRLAVEMGCPVLLLSQLNRKIEEGNREPQLSDLRESGAIEQDADIVIMLHADRRVLAEKDVPLQALVRKGRSSGTGMAELLFEKSFSNFRVNDGYRPDFDRRQAFDL